MVAQPLTWQVRPSKWAVRLMDAQPVITDPSCSSVRTSTETGKQGWSELAGTAPLVSADAKAPGESWGARVSVPAAPRVLARARPKTISGNIAFNGTALMASG